MRNRPRASARRGRVSDPSAIKAVPPATVSQIGESEQLLKEYAYDFNFCVLGRGINQLIEMHATSLETLPEACAFVCECEDGDCIDQIQMPLQNHQLIRQDILSFMVVDGHQSGDDLVLRREASWLIVRKAHSPDESAKTGVA